MSRPAQTIATARPLSLPLSVALLTLLAGCAVPSRPENPAEDPGVTDSFGRPAADTAAGDLTLDTGADPSDGDTASDTADLLSCYPDDDRDGWGDTSRAVLLETCGSEQVGVGGDCDDTDPTVYPEAPEVCDDRDDDCDGVVDEDAVDRETWYADGDGDGHGDPDASVLACACPDGYVGDATDCDDTNSNVHPLAAEICNDGLDNDCDGGPGVCVLEGIHDVSDADTILYGSADDARAGSVILASGNRPSGHQEILVGVRVASGDTTVIATVQRAPLSGLIDVTSGTSSVEIDEEEFTGDAFSAFWDYDTEPNDEVVLCGPDLEGVARYGTAWGLTETTRMSNDRVDFHMIGSDAGEEFGSAVVRLGRYAGVSDDVLAVGAPGLGDGVVYLLDRPSSSTSLTAETSSWSRIGSTTDAIGSHLAAVGDLDGDGYDDLAVMSRTGGPSLHGAVYLFSRPAWDVDLSDASVTLTGTEDNGHFGTSVAGIGDVNGDGQDDLLVGDDDAMGGRVEMGAAYVFFGPLSGDLTADDADLVIWSEDPYDGAGIAVGSAGDVNGDGYDDFLVAAQLADSPGFSANGAVYLFLGPATDAGSVLDADMTLLGTDAYQAIGTTVTGVGDVNEDGMPDFAVGAALDDSFGYEDGGAVYVFHGKGL